MNPSLTDLLKAEQQRQALRRTLLAGAESRLTPPADRAYFDDLRARVIARAKPKP